MPNCARNMTPWTKLVSTVVLGIGANIENLPVGLPYGLRGRQIGLTRNLVIIAVGILVLVGL